MEQDEIYLIDMWRIFVREWRWFVALLVVVLACTFAFTHSLKPQWEATAWIQIAQVGQAPAGQDPRAEPLQRVLERVQTEAFQNDVTGSLGLPYEAPEAKLYRKSLKLDPSFYANLIKLTVRATSSQQASQLATATVDRLHAIHQRIEVIPLQLAHASFEEIQAELQSALTDRDRLQQVIASDSKNDSLASLQLAGKNKDIRDLQLAKSELAIRLSPNYTFETSMVWPVYIPDHPVSPNPPLLWGVGVLLGLFLGGLAAVARNGVRRAQARAQ